MVALLSDAERRLASAAPADAATGVERDMKPKTQTKEDHFTQHLISQVVRAPETTNKEASAASDDVEDDSPELSAEMMEEMEAAEKELRSSPEFTAIEEANLAARGLSIQGIFSALKEGAQAGVLYTLRAFIKLLKSVVSMTGRFFKLLIMKIRDLLDWLVTGFDNPIALPLPAFMSKAIGLPALATK